MLQHAKEKVTQYNEYERKYGFTISQVSDMYYTYDLWVYSTYTCTQFMPTNDLTLHTIYIPKYDIYLHMRYTYIQDILTYDIYVQLCPYLPKNIQVSNLVDRFFVFVFLPSTFSESEGTIFSVRWLVHLGEDPKGDQEGVGVHRGVGLHVHRVGQRGVFATQRRRCRLRNRAHRVWSGAGQVCTEEFFYSERGQWPIL